MSDITCDYCGESDGYYFMRGFKPDGKPRWACESCTNKIMLGKILNDPPFIDTPLGQTPIDQQRP